MDGAKALAKIVVFVGVTSMVTGTTPASLLRNAVRAGGPQETPSPAGVATTATATAPTPVGGGSWYESAKPSCNAVEVSGYLRAHPFPDGWDGSAHGAACLALAGRIDEARAILRSLEGDDRWRAAGVVFDTGHPAADAGDDIAAGPLMELVVEFWPNHYMALYHAGASRYQRGDHDAARRYLERFLENYHQDDGWTRSARQMLAGL